MARLHGPSSCLVVGIGALVLASCFSRQPWPEVQIEVPAPTVEVTGMSGVAKASVSAVGGPREVEGFAVQFQLGSSDNLRIQVLAKGLVGPTGDVRLGLPGKAVEAARDKRAEDDRLLVVLVTGDVGRTTCTEATVGTLLVHPN